MALGLSLPGWADNFSTPICMSVVTKSEMRRFGDKQNKNQWMYRSQQENGDGLDTH